MGVEKRGMPTFDPFYGIVRPSLPCAIFFWWVESGAASALDVITMLIWVWSLI